MEGLGTEVSTHGKYLEIVQELHKEGGPVQTPQFLILRTHAWGPAFLETPSTASTTLTSKPSTLNPKR